MLRREVQIWSRRRLPRAGVLVLGTALATAGGLGLATHEHTHVRPAPAPISSLTPAGAEDFHFVVKAGEHSYLALAEVATGEEPPHGPLAMVGEASSDHATIAFVWAADLPAERRAWLDRVVLVEGGCRARVTGFWLMARVAGEPVEGEAWKAETVLAHGSKILAARLDGCQGSYARDAALAPVDEAIPVAAPAAVARAEALFRSSPELSNADARWREHGRTGSFLDEHQVSAQAVRHPGTGRTWVSLRARVDEGCGAPAIDLWALYVVDARGNVLRETTTELDDASELVRLVDVDGDGRFEAITRDWLGLGLDLRDAAGFKLRSLELAFFGCGC